MATMNVSLPEPMKTWVETVVNKGQYANSSDYIRDLIRRDQNAHEQQEQLIQALMDGENSGESEKSIDNIWAEVKTKHTNV